jgi:hypothetical protein
MFAVFILIIFIALFIYAICMLIRNDRVYRFRGNLLKKVSTAAKNDIYNNRPWVWRYDVLTSVPYNKMLYSFKKLKPENFWDDLSFIASNENDWLTDIGWHDDDTSEGLMIDPNSGFDSSN